MTIFVNFQPASKNKKTGTIPVTYSPQNTCPVTCPLYNAGCYAAYGPTAMHWRKVSDGSRGNGWQALCDSVKSLPKGQLWRHNVAGDLPHDNGRIDADIVLDLVVSNRNKRGFTYTHHNVDDTSNGLDNRAVIKTANKHGFTINLSANNIDQAAQYKALAVAPVVTIVPLDYWQGRNKVTHGTIDIIRCPAEYREDVTCASCGACAVADRKSVIAFTVHGTGKRKAGLIASDRGNV